MPVSFRFPKHIAEAGKAYGGVAESLSIMLMNNAGDSYADRGLGKGYELTNEIVDKGGPVLTIWFHLVLEDWDNYMKASEEAERANEEREDGEPKRYPMWAGMFMHFGDHITERINTIANDLVDDAETLEEMVEKLSIHPDIVAWEDELRDYVGFTCNAYHK